MTTPVIIVITATVTALVVMAYVRLRGTRRALKHTARKIRKLMKRLRGLARSLVRRLVELVGLVLAAAVVLGVLVVVFR